MKTFFTIATILVLLTGCSKDSASGYNLQLPPETQTGANTFGVTINGKVYVPRDPKGSNTYPSGHGMVYSSGSSGDWREINVIDGASAVGFKMIIHFKDLVNSGVGNYILGNSNFHNDIDSTPENHIYFMIWDTNISNYAYYGSLENQGEINVTKRTIGNATTNWILSGNFKGKFVRYDNPNDFITITDGRFDLNLNTLPNTSFP